MVPIYHYTHDYLSMSARGGSTPPSASPARKSEPQVVDLTDPSVEPVGAPAVK